MACKRIFCVVWALALLLSGVGCSRDESVSSTSQTTATQNTPSAIPSVEYYGFSQLKAMPEPSSLLEAYEAIVQAVEQCTAVVTMDGSLTAKELETVFFYYRADYPQHFWVNGTVSHRTKDGNVVQITLSYNMTGETLRQAKQVFSEQVKLLVAQVANETDEYVRELVLHDALAARVDYGDSPNAHNAYGAIVEKKAVCEGYARAFQYLLYQAGVQCLIAEGSSINPSTGKSETHAWNVAKINGQYYHVDLTWDDANHATVPVMYPYFNLTTAQMKQYGHVIREENGYVLPLCEATAANYHVVNGSRLTTYDKNQIAQLIESNPQDTHVFVVENSKSFGEWLEKNIKSIARKAGITTAFSYRVVNVGNEFVIQIDTQ